MEAARVQAYGGDGMRFLMTEDPVERLVASALATQADELDERNDRSRANMIANAVGKLFE